MRAIVHCGLHKTGTTSFQTQVYHSTSGLMSAGVYYPAPIDRAGIIGQHSQVALMLMAENRSAVTAYLEQVAADAEKYRWHTVLMSGEEFSSLHADPETFDFLTAELRRIFGEHEYVVVVRELVAHTASHIMQDTFEGKLALARRDGLASEAARRALKTAEAIRFFADRSDTRLLNYTDILKSGNFCNALLHDLVGPISLDIENIVDNTFDGKVTEVTNFAMSAVRAANSLVYGPKADLSELVDLSAFKASFNVDALLRFSTGLKRVVHEVSRDVVAQESDAISDILSGLPQLGWVMPSVENTSG